MNPLYDFEDIEDYVHDRMTKSDRLAFEQALETDAGLVKRLEAMRAEVKVLRLLRDQFVLEQFEEWEKEAPAKLVKMPRTKSLYRWWYLTAAAASLVGIIAAGIAFGWFGFNARESDIVKTGSEQQDDTTKIPKKEDVVQENPQAQSPNQEDNQDAKPYAALAKSTYIEEDFNQELMSGGQEENASNNYTKAIKLYNQGKYPAALKLLERPDSSQLQEYLYLRGYTYYHLQQYASAERDFRTFRTFKISDRKVDAQWCEVFCLVKQLPQSRNRLDIVLREIIANPQHAYYQRAVALQQALNKR